MSGAIKSFAVALSALALCPPPAWTQQKDSRVNSPIQPLPPITSRESSSKAGGADSADTGESNSLSPDTRPLSGARLFTLGSGRGPKYLSASLHFSQIADTNPAGTISGSGGGTGTGTKIDSASQLAGNLALRWLGSSSETDFGYGVGGTLYNTRSDLNQTVHQVNLAQTFFLRRWELLLLDNASYLPESSFGFGAFNAWNNLNSASGEPGQAGTGLNGPSGNVLPDFNPSQSILTGHSRRISNVTIAQVQYHAGRRSNLTASVSYGFLHFLESGFVDNKQAMFRAGYDRLLNRRDSLGLMYGFTQFRFGTDSQRIETHVVHLGYGRRITGRTALQFGAGPRVTMFRNVTTSPGSQVSFSASVVFVHHRIRDTISVEYFQGLTAGAGVFLGASSKEVQSRYDRWLTRRWAAGLDFGFAQNAALQATNLGQNNFRFWTAYAGADLRRQLGRKTNLSFTYRLQRQSSENSVCILNTCGTVFLRHQVSLTLDWNLRPIKLD